MIRKSAQWRRFFDGPLLDGEGERSAYSSGPHRGPDGRFHLLWMWRETPDAMTNHTLSYARSRDLIHWETSSGKPLARPITLANAEVIDPAKPGEGLINMADTSASTVKSARSPSITGSTARGNPRRSSRGRTRKVIGRQNRSAIGTSVGIFPVAARKTGQVTPRCAFARG